MKIKNLFITFTLAVCYFQVAAQNKDNIAVKLVDQQLNAYNQRNIEAFLMPYSDTVKVYMFPNKLLYQGKQTMRANYKDMFANFPILHCKLVNRIVEGNIIIDQEDVTLTQNSPHIEALAIYRIKGEKIVEVTFLYKDEKEAKK